MKSLMICAGLLHCCYVSMSLMFGHKVIGGGLHACISVYTTAHASSLESVISSVIASRLSTAHSLINPTDSFNNPLVETLGRAHGGLDGQ